FIIPKMHNAAHTQQCTLSLTLVDRVDGEQIERGWADLGPMVKPTRMMAPGKRHSVL
ncbi:hypothetical protein DFH06DRAFT_954441, partial [Mycena polygramma]